MTREACVSPLFEPGGGQRRAARGAPSLCMGRPCQVDRVQLVSARARADRLRQSSLAWSSALLHRRLSPTAGLPCVAPA